MKIDDKDRTIIDVMQQKGRVSLAELGRRIGLSAPAVHARVRQLEENGLIRDYVALLDRDRAGNQALCFVNISLASREDPADEAFRSAIREMPEVLGCYHVTGEFDYLLKVVLPSTKALEAFLTDRLASLPQVGRMETRLALSAVKEETALPLHV